jgi:hypothetical protein
MTVFHNLLIFEELDGAFQKYPVSSFSWIFNRVKLEGNRVLCEFLVGDLQLNLNLQCVVMKNDEEGLILKVYFVRFFI